MRNLPSVRKRLSKELLNTDKIYYHVFSNFIDFCYPEDQLSIAVSIARDLFHQNRTVRIYASTPDDEIEDCLLSVGSFPY